MTDRQKVFGCIFLTSSIRNSVLAQLQQETPSPDTNLESAGSWEKQNWENEESLWSLFGELVKHLSAKSPKEPVCQILIPSLGKFHISPLGYSLCASKIKSYQHVLKIEEWPNFYVLSFKKVQAPTVETLYRNRRVYDAYEMQEIPIYEEVTLHSRSRYFFLSAFLSILPKDDYMLLTESGISNLENHGNVQINSFEIFEFAHF